MTAPMHPSLTLYVTPEQRERAENWLQEAYADRRITEDEFDRRIGQVLSAVTRQELNEAFYGLVQLPVPSSSTGASVYRPLVPQAAQPSGRGVAALAHVSVFFLWLLGPALVFGLSQDGSYARKEAAKAFNFQLTWFLVMATLGMAGAMVGVEAPAVFPVLLVAWFVLTIVGAGKALQGDDWKNPVRRIVPLQVLSEK